ncbi:MAG: prefoldin subunit alpha [Candidatus Woesearchaeota archaeon]|jgi:prefoldin alpha subunit|nr:prefoldin subunit alpha [Candidatus Woesearchaeota archaeon]MDP7622568.1 prefoldin subunit alpha [Candidatus Woesearchaeota archaeon]HJN57280.1 prefoldin subunit alpha [Candidatus Woesearchaeota archaeon]|tara:strand:+ start:11208 stop:11630 length:423 start_codon:yes stop_codon:yes gene_type:complete
MTGNEEQLQKLYLEFQMLDQHIKQLEKQNTVLNSQLTELIITNQGLEDMKKVKKDTEILVPLSSGIYAKAELKDSNNFIVNVGSNLTVVKDLTSTKKLIETQVDELKKLQENTITELQKYTTKAAMLETEINKIASTVKK